MGHGPRLGIGKPALLDSSLLNRAAEHVEEGLGELSKLQAEDGRANNPRTALPSEFDEVNQHDGSMRDVPVHEDPAGHLADGDQSKVEQGCHGHHHLRVGEL